MVEYQAGVMWDKKREGELLWRGCPRVGDNFNIPLHGRRALRAWATRQIIFANSAPGADLEKIERDHEPLLHMLM